MSDFHDPAFRRHLAQRNRAEMRFRWFGRIATTSGVVVLLSILFMIISHGLGAFRQSVLILPVHLSAERMGIFDPNSEIERSFADYGAVLRDGLANTFSEEINRSDRRALASFISAGASFELQDRLEKHPQLWGKTLTLRVVADDDVDMYVKSRSRNEPLRGRLTEQQTQWLDALIDKGVLVTQFNTGFFTNGDSAEPEQAGILGALLGSFFTMLVVVALSFPIGVAAAVYLEEYARQNRFTDFIEANINNLAAVPSVIYGLLGLAVFINAFGMPRSVPLVAGLVLTLMTLPTIIISSRAAIKAVPNSLRDAAYGMGASKMQVVIHHVMPQAMPGMLTGSIIGMAQALGETAPLLMLGMVAFVVDLPQGVSDPATVLPTQIFIWADSSERAFVERTSAAIMVLLAFLITMNSIAVYLRRRLEKTRKN